MSGPVKLNQKITLWKITGENGSGGYVYSDPIVADGKFALKNDQLTDANGEAVYSKAVFYTEQPFEVNIHAVYFGESNLATPPKEAELVKAVKHNPSMFGELRKGWV